MKRKKQMENIRQSLNNTTFVHLRVHFMLQKFDFTFRISLRIAIDTMFYIYYYFKWSVHFYLLPDSWFCFIKFCFTFMIGLKIAIDTMSGNKICWSVCSYLLPDRGFSIWKFGFTFMISLRIALLIRWVAIRFVGRYVSIYCLTVNFLL